MRRLYVYALLPEDDDVSEVARSARGVAGEQGRLVRAGALAAVVGEVAEPPVVDLASLGAHDALVRRVATVARALLPMRFGQVVADEEALARLVECALPRLRAALAEVEGCEQTTWRVFGARETVPETAGAEAPAGGGGRGTRSLAARRARRLARAETPPALAAVLASVAPLVRAERLEHHGSGPLLASVHQLVRRADRDAYRRRLGQALAGVREARVRVGAPSPPYAFAGRWPA